MVQLLQPTEYLKLSSYAGAITNNACHLSANTGSCVCKAQLHTTSDVAMRLNEYIDHLLSNYLMFGFPQKCMHFQEEMHRGSTVTSQTSAHS